MGTRADNGSHFPFTYICSFAKLAYNSDFESVRAMGDWGTYEYRVRADGGADRVMDGQRKRGMEGGAEGGARGEVVFNTI